MKKLGAIVLVSLLATTGRASDLATTFDEAVALAENQNKDRASRAYDALDFKPYYQQKYGPLLVSCLNSADQPDTSTFSFVVAIGKDGHVLRLYVDHETNMFACVKKTLKDDKFPAPPHAPYYNQISMRFSK